MVGDSCVAHDRAPGSSWFEFAEPSISAYDGKYHPGCSLSVTLPGEGVPGAGCGVPKAMLCEKCGRGFVAHHACMSRECPDCFEKWAYAEGKIAGWRLWSGAALVGRELGVRYHRIVHAIVSFPDEGLSYESVRTRVYRVCREHGLVGGMDVFHPFRQNDEGEFVPDGYFHFHVLGLAFGNIVPGGQERDGDLVFKVIPDARNHDYRGFRSPGDLRKCIAYQLTHCGIVNADVSLDGVVRNRHAVTWFGVLSYNKLGLEKLVEACPKGYAVASASAAVRCPLCGSRETVQVGEYRLDGLLDPSFAARAYRWTHDSWRRRVEVIDCVMSS